MFHFWVISVLVQASSGYHCSVYEYIFFQQSIINIYIVMIVISDYFLTFPPICSLLLWGLDTLLIWCVDLTALTAGLWVHSCACGVNKWCYRWGVLKNWFQLDDQILFTLGHNGENLDIGHFSLAGAKPKGTGCGKSLSVVYKKSFAIKKRAIYYLQ